MLYRMEGYSLALQRRLGVDRINYGFYKGSSWFSITHGAAKAAATHKKAILKRFRFGANTDESWLQVFLMESGFAGAVTGTDMRYTKWRENAPSPEILTITDLDDMLQSGMLFARKFDWNVDRAVIFALAQHREEEDNAIPNHPVYTNLQPGVHSGQAVPLRAAADLPEL